MLSSFISGIGFAIGLWIISIPSVMLLRSVRSEKDDEANNLNKRSLNALLERNEIGLGQEVALERIADSLCLMSAPSLKEPGKKSQRETELEDLLVSARAIAERKGVDTAWVRFSERLGKAGIGCITAKTFRVLESDECQS